MAVPFYIPVSGAGYLPASPHSRQSSLLSDLILAVLVGVKWHLVALIFVPPMASDVECLMLVGHVPLLRRTVCSLGF